MLMVSLAAAPSLFASDAHKADADLHWTSPQSTTPTTTHQEPAHADAHSATPADAHSDHPPAVQSPAVVPAAPYVNSYPVEAYPAPVSPYGYSGQNSINGSGGHLPGGPNGRVGHPYYYQPQQYDPAGNFYGSDPYTLHFGTGYYRANEYGHHRFPYYSYRRPWYFPGHTSYNRDTNLPW